MGPNTNGVCPHCGFRPMLTKTTSYSHRIVVTHWCAKCQHTYDSEHGPRAGEVGTKHHPGGDPNRVVR